LYGGGDETIECRKVYLVKIRYPQLCMAYNHAPAYSSLKLREMPAGTQMIRETAKVDGQFGTCYTCLPCIVQTEKELREDEK
jgi:hypothetical protein